jgi:hypothetical protein
MIPEIWLRSQVVNAISGNRLPTCFQPKVAQQGRYSGIICLSFLTLAVCYAKEIING